MSPFFFCEEFAGRVVQVFLGEGFPGVVARVIGEEREPFWSGLSAFFREEIYITFCIYLRGLQAFESEKIRFVLFAFGEGESEEVILRSFDADDSGHD